MLKPPDMNARLMRTTVSLTKSGLRTRMLSDCQACLPSAMCFAVACTEEHAAESAAPADTRPSSLSATCLFAVVLGERLLDAEEGPQQAEGQGSSCNAGGKHRLHEASKERAHEHAHT